MNSSPHELTKALADATAHASRLARENAELDSVLGAMREAVVAVSADEIDGTNLDLKCWINGELRQHNNTRNLIFDIPTLIATISAGITLHPGDIIATGTPEGVGIGFDPPRFLKRGDIMTIEIKGIGKLENKVE